MNLNCGSEQLGHLLIDLRSGLLDLPGVSGVLALHTPGFGRLRCGVAPQV